MMIASPLNSRRAFLCDRFDVDLARAELVFSDAGVVKIRAHVQLVGTYSDKLRRWRWGWDHAEVPSATTASLERVREYGRAHGIARLTTGHFDTGVGEDIGYSMMVITAKLIGAIGVYKVPSVDGTTYLILIAVEPATEGQCSGRVRNPPTGADVGK